MSECLYDRSILKIKLMLETGVVRTLDGPERRTDRRRIPVVWSFLTKCFHFIKLFIYLQL